MMNISKITKVLSLVLATAAFILMSGNLMESYSQNGRDPFATAPYQKPVSKTPPKPIKPTGTNTTPDKPVKVVPKGPYVVDAPPIDARIDYYKKIRQEAAMNGQPIPKVTSVLLVDEMSVTGIFKTPRGYAAMIEATPIKLSYTIYPGEKFFDGQLVAVEENRLVFRKVTKWSNNKFVSSVQNKALQEFSLQQEIQGTSPSDPNSPTAEATTKTEAASNNSPNSDLKNVLPGVIVSPLDEMNNQPAEKEKDSAKDKSERSKKGKKRASNKKKRT